MKHFWMLPATVRAVLASPHSFSVHDDLLAYPQYEIIFSDTYIPDAFAASRVAWASSASAFKASATDGASYLSDPALKGEISKLLRADGNDHEDTGFDDNVLTYEAMILGDHRYLCSIPSAALDDDGGNKTNSTSSDELEKELSRASDRGWELLKGMQGNCLYYMSGWWSYSFCYNVGVRQFHPLPPSRGVPLYPPVEDPTVPGFELGLYMGDTDRKAEGTGEESDEDEKNDADRANSETGLARLETRGEVRYLVQRLHGGSTCDLTGKDRKIEVQFHCNPNSADRIGLIKEVAICSYLMVVHTPRLCNDVAFLPPQESKANTIACKEILRDDEVDAWKERKTREAEGLLVVGGEEDMPTHPVVGGIEVGAQKDVGSEGKVIEKSVVVGGGKETYIDTLASSDGKTMDEKGLQKLNMMNSKELEVLKQQLQRMAKGKGWKLDLVDTPRGRELRGVIDTESDAEGSEDRDEDYEEDGVGEGTEETYKEDL
ncbi:MAG: Protein OS-9 [Bathelium mastoideum]|nr:MAG: Protein OS-9 [Bathelium mastoideum]KAI9694407.1 MAG: Protein OS-9 [Bathelium mastoideum]